MEIALVWNAIKKTLIESGREDIFKYIKSIKISNRNIIISTKKPIVNSELMLYKELILVYTNQSLKSIGHE
jgi:hypothetical protein